MGSFGDAVASLVDTYTQCLAFLKDLGRGKQAGEQGSELRRALRKARSKIRRVYSSKLSRQGSSFERGDGEYTIRTAPGPRARMTPARPGPALSSFRTVVVLPGSTG
jgi:hypothetical protein